MARLGKIGLIGVGGTAAGIKGSIALRALGGPAPKMSGLHNPQVGVPLQPGPLKILHWPPIFEKNLGDWVAEDWQAAFTVPKKPKVIGQCMPGFLEKYRC